MSSTKTADTTGWNTLRGVFLGRAVGQTFLAPETLLKQVTVWRPPNYQAVIGAHLFITGVDTTQVPPRPDVDQLLLDGPTVLVHDSDPPGQLIPMQFVIDPPLVLPRRGTYAFFLQAEECHQAEAFRVIANDLNPYPGGSNWLTGRADAPCFLGDVEGGDPADIVFDVVFCRSTMTGALRQSWGKTKAKYR